jgi:hypothetical protein
VSVEGSDPDLLRTLRELDSPAVPVPDAAHAQYRREHVVRAIGRALERVRRSNRPLQKALRWAAAASFAALLGGSGYFALSNLPADASSMAGASENAVVAARTVVGTVTIGGRTSSPAAAAVGDVFRGGEVVTTEANSRLGVGIEAGTAEVGASSRLEFVPPNAAERRLRLGTGSVNVDLPVKLAAGRRLVVETPNVEVIVIGTAFSVGVREAGSGVATSVTVRRGSVRVMENGKQRALLVAGQQWESSLPIAASKPVAETPAPPAAPKPAAAFGGRTPDGTLAEENRLFQAGLSARNSGDPAAAAEAFATLLARYPRSVLAEQALAERFRALARAGRLSAAVVSARRYLAQYPRGFARTEAERLTQGPLDAR